MCQELQLASEIASALAVLRWRKETEEDEAYQSVRKARNQGEPVFVMFEEPEDPTKTTFIVLQVPDK